MIYAPVDGVRIGMLTPSSNTVLEPYTAAMFAPFGDEASAHFGRFRVVEISLSDDSQNQFRMAPILEAAERLAEARPRLIVWNGTSASWLGLDTDRVLCAEIEARTGIPATSTMLGFDRILRAMKVRRLGLVTPYIGDIQSQIRSNFARQGIEVVAEARLDDKGNYSFATYPSEQVGAMIGGLTGERPDAIAVVCTNFRGAPVAERIEASTGVTVLDSVAVTAAHSLSCVGLNPARITGWGSVFRRFSEIA